MTAAVIPLPTERSAAIPGIARTATVLFLWVLPFHMLAIAFLYGGLGLPEPMVRAIAAWKEMAILALLAWAILRAAAGTGPRVAMSVADVPITGLIGIAVLFALTENYWFHADIPPGAELYGFRDTAVYMLMYYVGRGTPELADDPKLLRRLFVLALVISSIGILERILVSPDMLVVLGVAKYFNEFLNSPEFTVQNKWDLPTNYWSVIGGVTVRRIGSVFLSSQGFATPFTLFMPAATAWALTRSKPAGTLTRVGYAVIWTGLLLSITRMTILVCFLQLMLWFVIFRRPEWAVGSVLGAIAVFAMSVVLLPALPGFVWETLTWQTGSSQTHIEDWLKGAVALAERPWGHGLGTSDQVAVRFDMPPVTADNLYFKYAAELGIAGLVALLGIFAAFLRSGWRVFRGGRSEQQRRFGAVIAIATLGIIVNGITVSMFNSPMLSTLYFWLAGVCVTSAQRVGGVPALGSADG